MNFAMDQLQPVFNAVADVDYGPTTTRRIRYTIADFKRILKRFLEEFITGEGPWAGPVHAEFTLYESAAHTGTNPHAGTGNTIAPYVQFSLSGAGALSAFTGNTSTSPEFFDPASDPPACPFVPGSGPPEVREDADLEEFATGSLLWAMSLFSPAIEQASWAEAAHVWLPFEITIGAQYVYAYTCQPSGVTGNIGGAGINDNVLGIDYAGAGLGFGIPPTSSIPLGDGTTELFLWTPTNDRLMLDTFNTRVGLD